jgi:capsular polysaccharide transport system permease protein
MTVDNEDRIRKWRAERLRVAEEDRDTRAQDAAAARQARAEDAAAAREARVQDAATARQARAEEAKRARQEQIAAEEENRRAEASEQLPSEDMVGRARMLLLERRQARFRELSRQLALFIGVPTLIVAVYLFFIATPLFETESAFTVQTSQDSAAPPAGGLFAVAVSSSTMPDAFKAREFILSHQMMTLMEEKHGFMSYFESSEMDPLSRLGAIPGLNTDRHAYYLRRVKVGVDVQEGLLRLHVQARTPEDAVRFARNILEFAELQVNHLSEKVRTDQITSLNADAEEAEKQVLLSRREVAAVQSRRGDIAPEETTAGIYQLISNLEIQVADTERERDTLLQNGLDKSPMLPRLEARISALQKQIGEQRGRLVDRGSNRSLQRTLGEYENAMVLKEIAQTRWESALRTLEQAKLQVLRQRRYFVIVVEPSAPTSSSTFDIFGKIATILLALLGIYAVVRVILAMRRLRG